MVQRIITFCDVCGNEMPHPTSDTILRLKRDPVVIEIKTRKTKIEAGGDVCAKCLRDILTDWMSSSRSDR